jgi:hypothetical protein
MSQLSQAIAIIIGALIIAAAILVTFRWEYSPGALLDRWTGAVRMCAISHESDGTTAVKCELTKPHP